MDTTKQEYSRQRSSPRVRKLFFISYINKERDEQKTPVSLGRTTDISSSGVGMEIYQQISVDSIMEMEIDAEQFSISVQGTVAHVRDLGDGRYLIGVQFSTPQDKLAEIQ